MAISKCPRCEGTRFEMKEANVKDSRFKLTFVQCAACGTVVGVMDYYNMQNVISDTKMRDSIAGGAQAEKKE